MFKKAFFVVLISCLMTTLSAEAALRSGLYMGLTAGASMMRSKINKRMERDTTFVSTLALGGRFGSVRLAGEIMMNTKADYDKGDGKLSYEANAISFQGYYDVPVRSMIRPFFNIGIGYYGSDIKGEPDVNDSANKMMWNVGAGFTLAVSRSTSLDLDIVTCGLLRNNIKMVTGTKFRLKQKHIRSMRVTVMCSDKGGGNVSISDNATEISVVLCQA